MASVRRLSAVMFTDTVGYTAATQSDEARTLELLRQQEELIRPILALHQGREIKSTGDGLLVEFDSALRATQCAVNIQRRIFERNAEGGLAPIRIRIGIHLGDVVQRGTDILGDAVNIAARIEPVAEPGGVCISGAVYDQVRNKIAEKLEKLPPVDLKGLETRVDIYRVALPWAVRISAASGAGPTRVAVLPFANISPDPKDEYFADGLTEELITALAELPELLVIARTSVIRYKSTTKPIPEIGAELGVSNVVEGSVRKAGDQLRITVQLIDVGSQGHKWAHTYDRKLDDVFAVQTEVAKQIAEGLKVKTGSAEQRPLEERPTLNPESYLAYLRGRSLFNSEESEKNFLGAKKQFELALELDPRNARALSGLADVTRYIHYRGFPGADPEWDRTSRDLVSRAIELDPSLAEPHCTLASILWDNFEYVEAEREFRLALALNPSYAQAHHWLGALLMDEARTEEALGELTLAEELNPQSTLAASWHIELLLLLRRLDEAIGRIERLRALDAGGPTYLGALADYYYARGDFSRALDVITRFEKLKPEVPGLGRAYILAATGKVEEARRVIEAREKGMQKPDLSALAGAYAVVGDFDASFRVMEEAVRRHDIGLQFLRNEPMLEPLRRDPRFLTILKKMNLS